MKQMLIIGGTGIIGAPLVTRAMNAGYKITVIANSGKEILPRGVDYREMDRNNMGNFYGIVKKITKSVGKWDVVVDINAYDDSSASVLQKATKGHADQYFILSTTLVYDRSKLSFKPISEEHALAQKESQGKYVDDKIALERFWQRTDSNWTILRPYHILGRGSLLGCLPPYNRDPRLPNLILSNCPIRLCDGGRIPLNVTHPQDLGEIIIKSANNPRSFGKIYNAVNPTEVIARDYFKGIFDQLGIPFRVKSQSSEKYWKNPTGWSLTTLPHMYDTSKLFNDIGYFPNTSLAVSIKDALENMLSSKGLDHSHENFSRKSLRMLPVHQNMNKQPYPKEHRDYAEE